MKLLAIFDFDIFSTVLKNPPEAIMLLHLLPTEDFKFMHNKVEICGVNTSKLKVLSNDETNALLIKYKNGDLSAREELISGNLRLVLSVIRRFANRGEMIDDLFQIGCVGLIKAIDNFDVTLGLRLSTYAVPMVIGELRRFLRDNSAIRVSRSMRDTAYKALKTKEELTNLNQREPTISEIAKAMDKSTEEIVIALDGIMDPVSLYDPVYSDSGGDTICVMDQVGDTKNTDENWLEHIALKEAIENLSTRERLILSLRFYDGKTQTEVASEIGISQAQVSRLEKSAIDRIKKQL